MNQPTCARKLCRWTILLTLIPVALGAAEPTESDLVWLLQRFPEADHNRDGVLTLDEARQFQAERKAKRATKQTASPDADGRESTGVQKATATLADVSYGPHERHVLDFYRADSDRPTGVLIFFHGGGFRGGDKQSFADRAAQYLDAGISVVSANYRYSQQAIYPGPLQDGARVVQFVRNRAREWNIDPQLVAVSGSSAGGLMALWIALRDDMADGGSRDPVARQSTRVRAVIGYVAACSIEPEFVKQHLGTTEFGAVLPLFGVTGVEELMTTHRAAVHEASPVNHLSPDDPPLLLIYNSRLGPTPLPPDTRFSGWIHHPKFGELLKARCDELRVACDFFHGDNPAPEGVEVAFLKRHLVRRGADRQGQRGGEEAAGQKPLQQVVYKSTTERDLKILLDYPPDWKSGDRRAALVFFYNGGWNPDLASRQFADQASYFARRGLVVARADYREKSREGVSSTRCIEDTFSAMRWLRGRADQLGIDASRVAAAGGSGSIHLAAAALYLETIHAPDDDLSISPWPSALFLYHPDVDVLNPEVLDRMLENQASDETRLRLPPTTVIYGSRDVMATSWDDIIARAESAGLPMEKYVFPGGLHGFFKFSPGLEASTRHVDQTLVSLGFLVDEPKVPLPAKEKPPGYDEKIEAMQQQWLARHNELAAARRKSSSGAAVGRSGNEDQARSLPDPTPAGYAAAMKKNAQNADSSVAVPESRPEVTVPRETFVYQTFGTRQLVMVAHLPPAWQASDRRPAILFFEGGVMNPTNKQGERHLLADERARQGIQSQNRGPAEVFVPQSDYFARRGLLALRVEVRKRATDGALPEDAVADGAAAVRWVRASAAGLGVAPDRIIVAGSSGGSHVAASLYALPGLTRSGTESSDAARPDVLILYSPLIDWLDPGPMGPKFLDALDGDRERADRLSPARHWGTDMPPTLVFLGEREPTFETVSAFAQHWSKQGKPLELFIGEGAGHTFAGNSPWLERTVERADQFLTKLGYLGAEPKVSLPHREKEPKR